MMSGPDALRFPGYVNEQGATLSEPSACLNPRDRASLYLRHRLNMRRQRDKRFGQVFTTDRGWDLLLLLMLARLEGRTTSAGEIFADGNVHGVTIEELERQIGLGNVVLMDSGADLERSPVVLSDEAARHLVDLYRIDAAAAVG